MYPHDACDAWHNSFKFLKYNTQKPSNEVITHLIDVDIKSDYSLLFNLKKEYIIEF